MRTVVYVTTDTAAFSHVKRASRGRWDVCRVKTYSGIQSCLSCGCDAIFVDPVLRGTNGKHLLARLALLAESSGAPPIFVVSREYCIIFVRYAASLGLDRYYALPGDTGSLCEDVERVFSEMDGTSAPECNRANGDSCAEPSACFYTLSGAASRTFLGNSHAACKLKNDIFSFRESLDPVLISGESGSGKELTARMVHENSRVHAGPFVAVNVSCIPAALPKAVFSEQFAVRLPARKTVRGYLKVRTGERFFLMKYPNCRRFFR